MAWLVNNESESIWKEQSLAQIDFDSLSRTEKYHFPYESTGCIITLSRAFAAAVQVSLWRKKTTGFDIYDYFVLKTDLWIKEIFMVGVF